MYYMIKYWMVTKWRKWKRLCLICGRSPINNKCEITADPYYSDSLCRGCMKLIRHSQMYGMGRRRIRALIDRSYIKQGKEQVH